MTNNENQEPYRTPLANGCPPPTTIGTCANLTNQAFLPCQDPEIDRLGPEEAIRRYTNLLRTNLNMADNMNRPMLVADQGLTIGARAKANEMVQYNYFGHIFQGRDAIGLATQLRQTNTNIWTNCIGENLHRYYSTPYEIFAGWFCSIGHFNNMTNPRFDRVGIAFAPSNQEPDRNKWVMWLASSSDQFGCNQPVTPRWELQGDKWYYFCNCLQPGQNGYWTDRLSDGNWYWLDNTGAWTGWKYDGDRMCNGTSCYRWNGTGWVPA
ncbi:CAP domain-containing protein [Neobacillus drentensis]|uniref:CAP domain-containing protein n=1 Tax=Neobacillus drentensis TaxID=220684 RepID=UPI003003979C